MQLSVVTDRLESLATELDGLAARFEEVAQRRIPYAGYSDARHVEEGLHDFFAKWTDGMERLHGQLGNLAANLHRAAATYDANEAQIAAAADPGAGQG
jgi:hypothetical protein